MRVISGSARGRKLQTLEGLTVRPTTDRVKEALFSMIQFDLPARRFLDLFAGSGQIGIEALSRGAAFAVFIDENHRAQQMIKANLQLTQLYGQSKVLAMQASDFLAQTKDRFDIVFLDPPYAGKQLPALLTAVAQVMTPEGILICEHSATEALPQREDLFSTCRSSRYSKVMLTQYRKHQSDI